MMRPAVLILSAVIAAAAALAQEEAPPKFAATQIDELKAKEGEEVIVTGMVKDAGRSRTGINFLNFADSTFVAVTFPQQLPKFEAGEPADVYEGKQVEIRGTLDIYKGEPQIKLEEPGQISIVEKPDGPSQPVSVAPMEVDPEPAPEPQPEAELETKPESAPAVAGTAEEAAKPAPGVELVNGEPPVDWKRYFPN